MCRRLCKSLPRLLPEDRIVRLLPISQRTPTRCIAGLMLPLLRDTTPRGAYTKVQRGPPGKPWFATRDPTTGAEAPTRKARPVEPPPNQESRTAHVCSLVRVLVFAIEMWVAFTPSAL